MFIVTIPPSAFTTMRLPFILSESGRVVDLRGVPLPVSILWAGDSLVNRRTYTLACGPVFGAHFTGRSCNAIRL